jgi:hypothetical protein
VRTGVNTYSTEDAAETNLKIDLILQSALTAAPGKIAAT